MKIKEMIYSYLETNHADLNKMEDFANFIGEYFCELKNENHEMYYDFKEELDRFTFDLTLDNVTLALSTLQRKDGKTGCKWSKEDTDAVAKQYALSTKIVDYCDLEFFFGMNYAYATHYEINRTIPDYIDLAYDEIHDKNITIKHKICDLLKK